MNRNTVAVLVSVAVSLVAGLGQAQVTCNWTSASGGYFSTNSNWGTAPTLGGSNDYVLMITNSTGVINLTNDLGNPTFVLNGIVANMASGNPGDRIIGSNLEFRVSGSGTLPFIYMPAPGGYGVSLDQGITLTTNLNISGAGLSSTLTLGGVISGSGSITNKRSSTVGYTGLSVTNAGNTFTGNWVNIGANVTLSFAKDGAIGAVSNNIILDNNGILAGSVTNGPGHVIVIGSGGGVFANNSSVRWMLTNENTLVGGGLLTLGNNAVLTVNAAQPNFTGQVVVGSGNLTLGGVNALTNVSLIAVTNGGTASLNSSNCLASTAAITVNRSGTLALSNAYAAGTATITNQSYGRITLNTNLVASGGTRLYLSDLSAVSGTDAQLSTLTDSGNVTVPPGAYPMVVHSTANGSGTIGNVDKTNLVYGLGANTNGNLTIGDAVAGQWRGLGGIASYAVGTSANTLTLNGNAVLDTWSGATLTISNKITGGNAANTLGIRGAGTVVLLNTNNDFASLIQGVGSPTLAAGHTANTMTFNFANGSNTFAAISNASSGTLVFDGAGSTNVLTSGFNTISGTMGTLVFNNGYYSAVGAMNPFYGNLTLDGATVVLNNALRPYSQYAVINIKSGSLTTGGLWTQTNGEWWNPTSIGDVTFTQSGGTVTSNSKYPLQLGNQTDVKTNSYYLSGGVLRLFSTDNNGALILAAPASGGKCLFSMTGGKLIANNSASANVILGRTTSNPGQLVFDFSGGTLATYACDATQLTSTNDLTVKGTLVNNGGTLAPGDIGTPGKTIITGIYSNTSSASVLAIDIGGTTQASAFTNAANYYDYVAISSNAYLGGSLAVNLSNPSYTPTNGTVFTVLAASTTAGATLYSQTFANLRGRGTTNVIGSDGITAFKVNVDTTAKNVKLTAWRNEWAGGSGSWSTLANWTVLEPNGNTDAAVFGTNTAGTVTLDANRTVKGLEFTNTASYTVSGANTLTLDNGTNVISVNDYAGSHAVNVPVAAAGNLLVNVARASDTLTFGSTLTQSGTGFTLTKTGAGTLTLSGNNTFSGATTVSNGTLVVTSSGTLSNSPTITLVSGATCDVSGVTGGYIVPAGQTVQGTGTLKGPVTINGVIRATLTDAVGGVSGPTYTGGVIIGSGATLDLGTSTNWLTGSTSTYTIIPSGVSGAAPGITLPRGWRVSISGGALKLVQGYAGTMILCQ